MRGESREKFTKKILRRIKFYTMIKRYESRLKGKFKENFGQEISLYEIRNH